MTQGELVSLIGEEVSEVAFVMDYVELHFNGQVLRALANPVLLLGKQRFEFPQAGSRDALCSLIGVRVTDVEVQEGAVARVRFGSGASLEIPIRELASQGKEALHFIPLGPAGKVLVW